MDGWSKFVAINSWWGSHFRRLQLLQWDEGRIWFHSMCFNQRVKNGEMSSTFLVSQQQSRSCCEHYIHSCMFCALFIMYLFLLHASNVLKMSVFLLGIPRSNRKWIFKNKWMEMLLLIHSWILIQNSAPEAPTPHIYPRLHCDAVFMCMQCMFLAQR